VLAHMRYAGHYDKRGRRWISFDEEAQIRALQPSLFDVAQDPTLTPEGPSAPCMSDLEAYGAYCPDRQACVERDVCQRWAARQDVILRAHIAAQSARTIA